MNAVTAFFYLFSGLLIVSALRVVTARNPVHSVLFLILAFVNAAGLFLLLGAEFLAMILVVVYVGAVAVLFLFVVMMLDVDFVELRQGFLSYLPVGGLVGLVFLVELLLVVGAWVIDPALIKPASVAVAGAKPLSNTAQIGAVLYTDYVFYFQTAGFILLVAMVGAIVLTLRERTGVKRQNIADQVARTKSTAIEMKKVNFHEGV
jgi:NADH-quinone oxidoreductase subunit J